MTSTEEMGSFFMLIGDQKITLWRTKRPFVSHKCGCSEAMSYKSASKLSTSEAGGRRK